MVKESTLIWEKVSGKKFKVKNGWSGNNSHEEDFFDEVEWELWKMFGDKKDPWNTEDKVKQQVNDFIVSIFDVMDDDEWLDKYSGLNQKVILKHAKRKGLKPIKKPIGEAKKRDSRGTLRDYKKEYKKYGSSTKSKKYRAELNQYNRKKGTYGNGDGKDASHKGGKIVGFESQSKNRGRAEKSRLKKEGKYQGNPEMDKLYAYYSMAMQMIPNSPKQKDLRKKIKALRKKLKMDEGKMSPTQVYDYFLYMRKYKPSIWKDMEKNPKVKKIMTKFESVTEVFRLTESGIMYRAGVKKYGKEGMRKIQSAAGKGLGHAEIGKIKDQYDKKKKKKKSESVDESTLTEGSVFDINNAEQMVKVLTAGLKKVAPDLKPGNISYSTLGGDERVSIVGKFSLDRKKDWSNGILENSRWITFYLDNDGSLEVNVMGYPFEMRKQVKMRKSRNKDIKQVLARMLKHFHMLNTKYPDGMV